MIIKLKPGDAVAIGDSIVHAKRKRDQGNCVTIQIDAPRAIPIKIIRKTTPASPHATNNS